MKLLQNIFSSGIPPKIPYRDYPVSSDPNDLQGRNGDLLREAQERNDAIAMIRKIEQNNFNSVYITGERVQNLLNELLAQRIRSGYSKVYQNYLNGQTLD